MANFKDAMEILESLEFSNSTNILHKNRTENGLTFYGIYENAFKEWQGWEIIRAELAKNGENIKKTSEILSKNQQLKAMAYNFYKVNFWDKIQGDKITTQEIAEKIFTFCVNVGVKNGVKIAQRAAKVEPDGIFGYNTLNALNLINFNDFATDFFNYAKNYYEKIVQNNPAKAIFLNGWIKRIKSV